MTPDYTEGRAEGLAIGIDAIAAEAATLQRAGGLQVRNIAEWLWINGRSARFIGELATELMRIEHAYNSHPSTDGGAS